jgi:hypothetical protein
MPGLVRRAARDLYDYSQLTHGMQISAVSTWRACPADAGIALTHGADPAWPCPVRTVRLAGRSETSAVNRLLTIEAAARAGRSTGLVGLPRRTTVVPMLGFLKLLF